MAATNRRAERAGNGLIYGELTGFCVSGKQSPIINPANGSVSTTSHDENAGAEGSAFLFIFEKSHFLMETIDAIYYDRYGLPKYIGQTMEKADFLCWESDDNYVYEFYNGMLEPTTGMRQDEILLFKRIARFFSKTQAYQQGNELLAEVEVWLTETQMRRPDIAYYTADQFSLVGNGEPVIPGLVIELASETDNELKSLIKRHEYFNAGVQVVWWVFPLFREVHVYTSSKTVRICTDNDMLSAAPILPELQMTVNELFS
ncbi:Uma2 family endonuclease [Spirosoma sp. KNUC1025]|uniref:Uma2 family endonuclease n=1 Tax=Spirosoma sp. KNUC1025 TaxID=2894082 RepID=UPI0038652B51|nr:Uma2 family endonuclease [Spirosoma sp. KNUC1025]